MSEPFLGEIRQVAFNFAPKGWALCNGQLLSIQQNTALFSILGTFYGGNGMTNFALPDLRGRAPVHTGDVNPVGTVGGEATHTLTVSEMPAHTHVAQAIGSASSHVATPAANMFADTTKPAYAPDGAATQAMSAAALSSNGGSLPHDNMPPYLTVNFVIALQGIFPSRS